MWVTPPGCLVGINSIAETMATMKQIFPFIGGLLFMAAVSGGPCAAREFSGLPEIIDGYGAIRHREASA